VQATIACGQFDPKPGDCAFNTGFIRSQAREAAAAGAVVLVLPELCLTGYPAGAAAAACAVTADGPEMERAEECAAATGIDLCFGFVERDAAGRLFNSMAYVDKAGILKSTYRKVHLWPTEREWAVAGDRFAALEALGISVGMWICYDTRFPEAARCLARSGATLGLVGAAWFGPPEEWELALRARALDNGMFVAGATVLGVFGAMPFRGASMIVDPHGNVLARAREGRTQVITARYDAAVIEQFRARLPLLQDLRPETYA